MRTVINKNRGLIRVYSKNDDIYFINVEEFMNIENLNIQRAGVILYNVIDEKYYYYLGEDKNTNELTDFGGGIKLNEQPIIAALRELRQETLNIFKFTIDDIKNFKIAYNDTMCIIFVKVDFEYDKVSELFKSRYETEINNNKLPEVCNICKLSEENFKNRIINPQSDMYIKVKDFLVTLILKHENFFKEL